MSATCFVFCRLMPFAAIRTERLKNDCRDSEFLFGSPHTFFTRLPSAVKLALRSLQIGTLSRRGIAFTKGESASYNVRHSAL